MEMDIPVIKSHHLLKEYLGISEKIIFSTLTDIDERTKRSDLLIKSLGNSVDQLRAVLNVTRSAYVKKAYKKNALLLSELSGLSANLNEYYKLDQLLNSLQNTINGNYLSDVFSILISRLKTDLIEAESKTDFDLLFTEYRNGLIKYKEAIKDVKPDAKNFSLFKKELRRIYNEGRSYINVLRLESNDKNLFKLSKVVKDFYFIISTLTPVWEILFDIYVNEIKSFSDSLSKVTGLYKLKNYIQSLIDNPFDFSEIITLIDKNLTTEIEKLTNRGELIYSTPPDIFAIHLKSFYSVFKNYSYK